MKNQYVLAHVVLFFGLSACGGTAIVEPFDSDEEFESPVEILQDLEASVDLEDFANDALISAATTSLQYSGAANFFIEDFPASNLRVFAANLSVTVDFDANSLAGRGSNLVQTFSLADPTPAEEQIPIRVEGSVDLTGILTAENSEPGGGIRGTAAGSIDSVPVAYTLSGNVLGEDLDGLSLSFSPEGPVTSGISTEGIAVR